MSVNCTFFTPLCFLLSLIFTTTIIIQQSRPNVKVKCY
nr:MAG TPA: hypothetical protein [Caudoviricetes sp.]